MSSNMLRNTDVRALIRAELGYDIHPYSVSRIMKTMKGAVKTGVSRHAWWAVPEESVMEYIEEVRRNTEKAKVR